MSLNQGSSVPIAAPVPLNERIFIIDALRGVAILGILLMNIPTFGLPGAAGWDPSVFNELGTIDYKTWYAVSWVPEGTQRALFSMLFGAGVLLFTSRQEQKLEGVRPAEVFIRRQLWLIMFSLFDVYILLWEGDILFDYAVYGIVIYVFRKLPPKSLLIAASICVALMFVRENRDFLLEKRTVTRGQVVAAIDTTKVKLTDKQKARLGAMQDLKDNSTKEKKLERTKKAITRVNGTYEELYEFRTNHYIDSIVRYTYLSLWDVLSFMFIGMAFFKLDILTGKAPIRIYWILCIVGLAVGLTLSYLRLQRLINNHFNWFEYLKNTTVQFYDLSRVFRTLGIFGLLMLLYRSGLFNWLFKLLRPVGQMAFTNYLTQSLLCAIFFSGIGFGMYGQLSRHQVYYVVGAIWLIQIIWSNIWLHYFRFGPMEWCWRSLTYWKRQPLRR